MTLQTNGKRGRTGARGALISAGLHLFSEVNSDTVSIDDIIRAADVSKQTFYNHFTDKTALLQAIHKSVRAGSKQFIDGINERETDAARRIARGLCAYASMTLHDRIRGRFLSRMLLDDLGTGSELNRGVVDDVALGLAQGRLSLLVLDNGVAFVLGTTQALVARILACPDLPAAVATSQQFTMLLLRACGVPHLEAEMIAGQAADQVVRLGGRHAAAAAEEPVPSQSRPAACKAAKAGLPGAGSDVLTVIPRSSSV